MDSCQIYFCAACREEFHVSRPYIVVPFCPSCGMDDRVQTIEKERDSMVEEVAGNIATKVFHGEQQLNAWLEENGEVEVMDIQLASRFYVKENDELDTTPMIMVVYRKEK